MVFSIQFIRTDAMSALAERGIATAMPAVEILEKVLLNQSVIISVFGSRPSTYFAEPACD
ncbi:MULTISPECIES: hypothetical protein [Pseudomonadaceae]|jgi:hypothetical protein|uniref:Uncharacterized protein n=2 Tax=Stutzerimonas stutzeri group TaxID=136846 RepID=A0AA40V7G8_STUST|nr:MULTISPECIES: hypothetical protein [Pseudomonadaceae]MBA4690564.1 hypothetical protein [Pseudomonas sp.]NMY66368.1 hypothetical protein [Pseudomonas sp. WS 5018]EKJ7650204.1 hypothetical protein [Pseudomonas aeruginosa]EMB2840506.1 hypothetical protein [Pseudomonas aeruginosa]MBA1307180.1 hypothetical protein [Stutzerimonas stutzeri]